jgi:hypothetical protein
MDNEHLYLWLRARLAAHAKDEDGITTLETILWIGGLAVLALAAIAAITIKITTATNNIPTGP